MYISKSAKRSASCLKIEIYENTMRCELFNANFSERLLEPLFGDFIWGSYNSVGRDALSVCEVMLVIIITYLKMFS